MLQRKFPVFPRQQRNKSFSPAFASSLLWNSMRFSSSSKQEIPAWIPELRRAVKDAPIFDTAIFDELAWRKVPYRAPTPDKADPEGSALSTVTMQKLCLGDIKREYTLIGETMLFADRNDSPVINEPAVPAKLYWDHSSPTEKLLIQLAPAFPPLLWLSVRPTHDALKKLFGEFLEVDSLHMKQALPQFEEVQSSIEAQHREKFGESLPSFRMKDAFMERMRARDPASMALEWPMEHGIFVRTVPHFTAEEERMRRFNPFVFGWPLMLSEGNHHLEGTAMRMAAFRTVYSKSLVLLHSRLDLQVDPRLTKVEADDEPDVLLDVPVMATINYPKNTRLSGGPAFVKRFNAAMETSFPLDTPVDVLGAFIKDVAPKGVAELRAEAAFLEQALAKTPDVERVVRLAEDLHGTSRMVGRLGFDIVYLALLEDPQWEQDLFAKYSHSQHAMLRVALAKGAMILQRPDLVERLVAVERDARCKKLMQLCLNDATPAVPPPA